MIDPEVARTEDGNPVSVGQGPPSIMRRRATDHGVAGLLAVMDVEAVDDDVGDVLDGDAGPISNVDVDAAAVDGLEAVHDELLLESDDHVPFEHDP